MTVAKSVLISAIALAAAGAVQAASTIDARYETTLGGNVWTSDSDDYLSGAMQYTNGTGQSFAAFCVELAQPHALNGLGFQTYSTGTFTGTTATMLQGLFSSSYASVTTDRQRAAFQVAVWEITHEADTGFDVDTGTFYFAWDGIDAASTSNFIALSNSYLQAAQAYSGPDKYSVVKLSSGNFQDLVMATAVPEPESYALMLGGLAAIGFIARRRKLR